VEAMERGVAGGEVVYCELTQHGPDSSVDKAENEERKAE